MRLPVFCILAVAAATGCGAERSSTAVRPASAPAVRPETRDVARIGDLGEGDIAREVHHELLMLPYYNVFDDLAYRVNGDTVTLSGAVTRPTLKSDAEHVVRQVEGVRRVESDIRVLPPSPNDRRIRLAEFQAIYGQPALRRYALSAVPPIHIIVDRGHVTLTGEVAANADKNLAGIQAKSVPGVFSVKNELQVES